MSSFDEMRILQKEADLAKKKLQEVENAGEVASNSGIKGNAENKNIYPWIFLTREKKQGILKLQNKGGSKSEKDFMHVAGVRALCFDAGRMWFKFLYIAS